MSDGHDCATQEKADLVESLDCRTPAAILPPFRTRQCQERTRGAQGVQ